MSTPENLAETRTALERMQAFDVSALARVADLGRELNFAEAVESASRLVELYKRIPVSILDDLTDTQLAEIRTQAQADYNTFTEIVTFSSVPADATGRRAGLISRMGTRRDTVFSVLWQFIAYGVARVTDTSVLEAQARATIQNINDRADDITKKLNEDKDAADAALTAIRAIAAEQGVSQQAEYFKREADQQEQAADAWLRFAYYFAAAVGAFALASLFLHKWEWIAPNTVYEAMQLIASKILIFTTLIYMLVLAARNYATNKHNAVVNRHRQNALLTYRALATAAAEQGTEDIVLANAAACIFSPQDTGYSAGPGKEGGGGTGARSVLELLTRSTAKSAE